MLGPRMKRHLHALAALLLGVLLGLVALTTPTPAPADAAGFSAVRARAHIDAIAAAPHAAWDQPSLVPVRDYLRGRLAALGLAVTTSRYPPITDRYGHTYPIENLSAAIPGRSGASLLLVSHYDAAPKKRAAEADGSRGAADDGYGVSTMLEIAGILAASKEPLENGVRFLFTDAEETGLFGARLELERNLASYRDVNFVVNVEARGVKGPAVMFETGPANEATLGLYRHANRPFAYSFAVDVYRRMPNGTDFTCFLQAGFPGLNFAVLEDLSYYHTPRDEPGNVSLASLQHYGEQILPVVRAYARSPEYGRPDAFASSQDTVYFSWLPWVFLRWSARADHALSALLFSAFVAFAWRAARAGRARPLASLGWLGAFLALALLAATVGVAISALAAKLTGVRFLPTYMPNVPFERPVLVGLVLAVALASYRLALAGRRRADDRSPMIGAMALSLVLLGVTTFALPGGTCLFSAPLLVGLAAVSLADRLKRPRLASIGVAFAASLYVPVLHLFAVALTFGALGALLLVAAFPLALSATLATEGVAPAPVTPA